MIMESQQAINYMYFLQSQCHIHISLYQLLTFEILLKKRRYMIWQIQKIPKIKSSHMKLKPANIFLFQAPVLLASVNLIFQT